MYIGICDDEINQVERIEKYVKIFFESEKMKYEIKATSNSKDLLASAKSYDIVFLDMEIKDESGIHIAEKIMEQNKTFKLIFVTKHSELIVKALWTHFFFYLLKPAMQNDINALLYRACDRITAENTSQEINKKEINLEYRGRVYSVKHNDILYAKSIDHGICVHTAKNIHRFNCTLQELNNELNCEYFIQINRSCLVNLINIVKKESEKIKMKNNEELKIAQRRKSEFESAFKNYIKNQRRKA